MIEIVAGSVKAMDASIELGRVESVGTYRLTGEIVDGKCWLGVMNPGAMKPHRACAIRCLSGGLTPLFVIRDAKGHALPLMLAGSDGRALDRSFLDYVAEPIEVTGVVDRHDDIFVLKADPATFRRAATY